MSPAPIPDPAPPASPPPDDPALTPPATPPSPEPGPEPKLGHDEAIAELAKVRAEAAKYRTENAKLTAAQQAADNAKLSEEEKRIARITELEAKLSETESRAKDRALYAAIVDAAARLGAGKPQMIQRLLDLFMAELAALGPSGGRPNSQGADRARFLQLSSVHPSADSTTSARRNVVSIGAAPRAAATAFAICSACGSSPWRRSASARSASEIAARTAAAVRGRRASMRMSRGPSRR